MTTVPEHAGVAVTAQAPAYPTAPDAPGSPTYQAPRPPMPGSDGRHPEHRVPGRAEWANGLPQHRCLNPNLQRGIRT
jgi:hypothetical protein